MFTEAERIRTIELYFKYGKKLAPVVRELGYPSRGLRSNGTKTYVSAVTV